MHVCCIPFEQLHGAQSGKVADGLRFEGVSVVALEVTRHQSIFEAACVVPLGFDDLAGEFYSFETFAGKGVDVDGARVDEYADCVAVGSVGVGTIDVAFEEFGVMSLDVLGCDDDFDLNRWEITV